MGQVAIPSGQPSSAGEAFKAWLTQCVAEDRFSVEILEHWAAVGAHQPLPSTTLGCALALIAEMEQRCAGDPIGKLLSCLLAIPLNADVQGLATLADYCLGHACWAETEKLAQAVASSLPNLGRWLRVRLAIEHGEPGQAADGLSALADRAAAPLVPIWLAEGHIRLAMATGTLCDDAWLQNEAVPIAVRIRYWLLRGQDERAKALLAAIGPVQRQSEADLLWLQGNQAARAGDRQAAVAAWNTAISQRPRLAGLRLDRGRYLLAWGEEAGGEDIEIALRLKPWAGFMVLPWIARLSEKGDYQRALQIIDHSLAARPRQPDLVAALLDVLRLKRDNAKADQVGQRAIREFPDNADIWLAWGNTLLTLKRRDQAIVAYRRAMDLGHSGIARSNLAKLLFDEGDTEEAIGLWQEALRHAPDDVVIRTNLAQALLKSGDLEEAEEHFEHILKKTPTVAAGLRGMAECKQAMGDLDAALAMARRALDLAPGEVQSYLVLAVVRKKLGQEKIGMATLEAGLGRATHPLPLHQAIWGRLMQRHEYEQALQRAGRAALAHPQAIEYRLMVFDSLNAQHRFDQCRIVLEEAKAVDRERAGKALVRHLQSRHCWEEALAEARSLLAAFPDSLQNFGLVAEVLFRMKRLDEAEQTIRQGLVLDPRRLSLNRQLIGQLMAREKFDEAVRIARHCLEQTSAAPQYELCLKTLERTFRRDEALDLAEKWLASDPTSLRAQLAVAHAAERAGLPLRAREVRYQGLRLRPGNITLNAAYIQALLRDEAYPEALATARDLLERFGEEPEAVLLSAAVLVEADLPEESRLALEKALDRHPRYQPLWVALYRLLRRFEQHEKAEEMLAGTADRFPDADDALGWVVDERMRYGDLRGARQAALQWMRKRSQEWAPLFKLIGVYEKQRAFNKIQQLGAEMFKRWPNEPAILSRLAQAYSECWQMDQALVYARRALQLRPDDVGLMNSLAAYAAKAGIFSEFSDQLRQICEQLGDRQYPTYQNWFFNLNCHPDLDAAGIFEYYKKWGEITVRRQLPPPRKLHNDRDPNRRLRVGYLSPDFRRHAVAYFSEPLLMRHDREQFEVFAFAHLEPGTADDFTERFKGYADHWIDVTAFSGSELYRKIRDLKIDLLFDLAGHTSNNKLPVMAQRLAPVQGSWIFGAGQTTGMPNIDVLLSDENNIPPEFEAFCTERVVRVGGPGLRYRPPDDTPAVVERPCVSGGFVTFATFTRPIRLSPQVLSLWAKVLNRLPTARLRLDHVPYAEGEMQAMIRDRYAAGGGNPEQLVFTNTRPHWNAFAEVDLVLDTFPTNTGTTVSEALWMGVPVITLESRPVMGRIAASQLKALGLHQECIAATEDDYVEKALALATAPDALAGLSAGLRARFETSPLMDYQAFSREVATTYRKLWQDWCKNNPEEHANRGR